MSASVLACSIFAVLACFSASSYAQDEMRVIDKSKIPATARTLGEFVPKGWIIEQQTIGYVKDGDKFVVLKLIEDNPLTDLRNRAMVIVAMDDKGNLKNAGVAGKLLQCPGCGGAFYGIMDAPADIKVDDGTIIIEQDGGSRWVWSEKYRFRFEPASGKFALIGFDYNVRDRNTGQADSESTNYATGDRVTNGGKTKAKSVKTKVKVSTIYLDDVDHEKMAEEAGTRLGTN